tara:strand:+ start:564 stop:797 length:234 start_codon:yes stop_codon:yes gene_type:complete
VKNLFDSAHRYLNGFTSYQWLAQHPPPQQPPPPMGGGMGLNPASEAGPPLLIDAKTDIALLAGCSHEGHSAPVELID